MNSIISGLFICESSSEGHAVLTGPKGNVTIDGPSADQFIRQEQYQIDIQYVGDKPPHP